MVNSQSSSYLWSPAFDAVDCSPLPLLWTFCALGFQDIISLSLFSSYLNGSSISSSFDGPSLSLWPYMVVSQGSLLTPLPLFSHIVSRLGHLLLLLPGKLPQMSTSFALLLQLLVQVCFISWTFSTILYKLYFVWYYITPYIHLILCTTFILT